MSRAGKFIPGGSNKAKRTGPIRAPEGPPAGGPTASLPTLDTKKRLLGKTPFGKPVAKGQRLPFTILSALVLCLIVSVAWYYFGYLPIKRNELAAQQAAAQSAANYQAELQKEHDEEIEREKKLAAEKGVLNLDTNPSGAMITVGDSQMRSPAHFADLTPGPYTVKVHLDGYEDYKANVTISPDKPLDLGTINLDLKAADLTLTTPETGVTYTLTGPDGSTHNGTLPDKLEKLPIGDYSLTATQNDWKLPPITFTLRDHEPLTKDIKFPYAKVTIASSPAGATVRDGRTILGTTPLTLPHVRPTVMHLSVDLPPYTLQRLDLEVADAATVDKQVTLTQDKDFIAASGMPMVWIPDGGFWAAKYPFTQSDFEKVAGYNPSFFRGPNLPVETISWESAQAFIDKLNAYEAKAGKLPSGFHYSLPKEVQWDQMNADADLSMAATSSQTPLSSTQNVGYSSPNKYGLYDTLGNVWEWCLDDYDANGNHTLRGGTWLSQPSNFPNAGTRQGGPPKYADKFIGFRVVLVPSA
jgi:hypothetical protein